MSFENNLAAFGRGYAYLGAFMSTIICIVIVIIAMYKFSEPDVPPEKPGDNRRVALIMLVMSVIILVFSWGWVWLTNKSKFAAEAGGVMGGINMVRTIFQPTQV